MMSSKHPSFLHNIKVNAEHEDAALGRSDSLVIPVEGCGCAHCFAAHHPSYAIGEPQSSNPEHPMWSVDGLKRQGYVGLYNTEKGEPQPYVPLVDAVCAYCGDVIMDHGSKHTLPVKVWDHDVHVHVACLAGVVDELSRMKDDEYFVSAALRLVFERLSPDGGRRHDDDAPKAELVEEIMFDDHDVSRRRRYIDEVRSRIGGGGSPGMVEMLADMQLAVQRHETSLSHLGEPQRLFDALDHKLDRGGWSEDVLSSFDDRMDNIQEDIEDRSRCFEMDLEAVKEQLDDLDLSDIEGLPDRVRKLVEINSKVISVLGVMLNTLMPGSGSMDEVREAEELIEEVEK